MQNCILIYDDDPDILTVCTLILTQHNYRVETRNQCMAILSDIDQINPDLILMDFWIPEMGGEKAVTLIKNNRGTHHIPIILFTANAEIEKIYKRIGADGFLKKPFEIIALLNVLNDKIRERVGQ
ncbi:MAG TPA: response regulator [Puia sp.]|jgi:DNA-binding response OmpR family regulator|nr:response regulator [Puia sp.]